MKNTLLSVSLWLALSSVAGHAWAEKADRNKPMNVEADALRYDDVKQVSVFSGHVVLTKGSILIRGAQIEVRQDPDGYQYGLVTGSTATPAFFRQKREGLDEFIEGDGDTIEYDGKADTVRFVKKAQLRRLRGATLADEVTGAVILYENLTDKFTVDGAPKTAAAPAGRVRAMLTPKPKPEGEAATAPQPGVTLRATPQLEKAAQ
ncbi:lipopolysaccharide transport periplasmic protein LptA [Rhodoferax saidenbachensis]|uniref:Lipopolysaccharide export system protein LptA n=1 Tax=Rhodoferax saidenbachensis TaxID=1484693 RepID=A0ABU1ZP56_9BURK|nr:lipopolysaccharide transport periplasmic protein LptA [Rhodoferax saidenbachensis]MDR7306731.1 lipopolysaccharide export system protein LptA [Rhodoferax saidenbachensis]